MKRYAFNKDINKLTIEQFKSMTDSDPITEKMAILKYMRSFPHSAYTTAPVYDRITGEVVRESDDQITDGTYIWYESWIYHFEKYDLKLNDDFIEYVLDRPA